MAKATSETKLDLKNLDLRAGATRTLYAGAGVADLAVSTVRGYVTQVQQSVTSIDLEPQALREQATTVVSSRVEALSKDARERRSAVEARVAELQAEALALPARLQGAVDDNVATLVGAYGDLAQRGEALLTRIRRQQSTQEAVSAAKTTTAKAKTTRTQGAAATRSTAKKASSTAKKSASATKKTAAKKSSAPRSSAKATVTAAKKTASAATSAVAEGAAKVGD
ncbi:hypothetical protein GHK92_19770 [Nocardioides sp. dk4132]|uniref:hypothetical protein n=1 Tax=unclassified Nocardioides TaxID=2615069 RepID=UPI001296A19B|nr:MULTISPECIES: hypothetical protein [unclassified Nocardioides]MQW78110.1 hypothetical protein [Nocardioides sp. dk4132]QGA09067.1 hypothetical protein GFH29_17935 [Nocardioides sp. dk884]